AGACRAAMLAASPEQRRHLANLLASPMTYPTAEEMRGFILDAPIRFSRSARERLQLSSFFRARSPTPPQPLHPALPQAYRPRLHRDGFAEPLRVVGQREGADVASLGLLLQALPADRIQVEPDRSTHRNRRLGHDGTHALAHTHQLLRRLAG